MPTNFSKEQRLQRAGFTKEKYTIDDLLTHLGTDISQIKFSHENEDGKPKVSIHSKDQNIGSGGETVTEALEWLIIAKHEKDNPLE